jgi:hypothetical protein
MINQMAERFWGADFSFVNPAYLIDKFLDQIEKLSAAIEPAQADSLSCREVYVEARFDQFGA